MRKFSIVFIVFILLFVIINPSIVSADVEIIGSWVSGTSHSEEAGTVRALVFTAHAESRSADTDLASVTYGGQSMTKVVEKIYTSGDSAYTCAFILDEAGIAAASDSSFVVTWNTSPSRTPEFTSVFLQDVNQSSLTGATGVGGSTTTTAETPALSTSNGDMAIVAGTCGKSGTYSTINGFIEAIEIAPERADGIAGYLSFGGSNVTPGISHTDVDRQSVIGFVVKTETISSTYNVMNYGATGNGSTLDHAAINAAINAAYGAGGGTVYFPPGTYKSGSIRLKSNITLDLHADATILATDTLDYDVKDENPWVIYAGFGNSYWKCSLIWAKFEDNIAITGSGKIYGAGNLSNSDCADGEGNKTVGFRSCNGVLIEDVTFHHCGHYAMKLTGCNDVTVENIEVDTNRDGITFDNCHDVNIIDCNVSAHQDDAITLKSTYAMGYKRDCNNVNISGCTVMGYELGTYLDGTKVPAGPFVGRIKFGTESVGGFRNVMVTDCTFESCMGFMIASVDGGTMENINISNITMDSILWPPIFIRLGDRNGASPGDPPPCIVRNININNVTARVIYSRSMSSGIAGIPGYYVQDVNLSNIDITYQGGGTAEDANLILPENNGGYPDPDMFGDITPSYAFYIRHANGVQFHNSQFDFATDDVRPAFVLIDVNDFELDNVDAERSTSNESHIKFDDVDNLNIHDCPDFPLTTATYGSIQSTKDKVLVGEEFNITVPAISGSTGVCTTDMDVDSSLFDTRYDWLNASVQKDVNFSDVQMYTPGERLVEISSSSHIQGVCMKEDFNLDFIVDYCDLDVMGQDWLQTAQLAAPEYDPVAWWKFDEESGSTASDSSVNNNTGTLHNMDDSDWIAGKYGNALEFDDNDYLTAPAHASMSFGTGSFSVALWIKKPVGVFIGTVPLLINGGDDRYEITRYGGSPDGQIYFVIDDHATNDKNWITSGDASFSTGDWVHCVCIRDAPNTDLYIYKDGVQVGIGNGHAKDIDSPDPMTIGNDDTSNCSLDDIRLYDYVLTEEEIATFLDDVYLPFPANLHKDGTGIVNFKDYRIFADSWLIDVID